MCPEDNVLTGFQFGTGEVIDIGTIFQSNQKFELCEEKLMKEIKVDLQNTFQALHFDCREHGLIHSIYSHGKTSLAPFEARYSYFCAKPKNADISKSFNRYINDFQTVKINSSFVNQKNVSCDRNINYIYIVEALYFISNYSTSQFDLFYYYRCYALIFF